MDFFMTLKEMLERDTSFQVVYALVSSSA